MARWRGRVSGTALGVAGIAVAAVVVATLVIFPYPPCGGLFSGLTTTPTRECVGVIHDAAYVDNRLGSLVADVDRANDDVVRSGGPYVKVALLTPLSVPSDGSPAAIPISQVTASLEGALTGMRSANDTPDFGSPNAARIQVLLVNQGSRQEYDPKLAGRILAEDEAEHPVVAVVGLGSSYEGTLRTAKDLAARGIPMVSAVASADDFGPGEAPGLRSVSPSNTEYVRALRAFLDRQLVLNSGVVVADQNVDSYTRSLREAFTRELSGYITATDLPFNGSTVDSGATPGVFNPVVTNLCNAANDPDPVKRLDMVFYAGRVADFREFVTTLDGRSCKRQPLAVLVGATGFDAANEYRQLVEDANVTVIYATSADAPAWSQPGPRTPQGYAAFAQRFRAAGFDDGALGDGYAIMYHDALVSAAAAVRLAAQGDRVPKARDVDTQFGNLALAYAVRGASGTLSFPPASDGRATGKLIPLRQIGRTTPIRLPADGCTYVVGGPCAA